MAKHLSLSDRIIIERGINDDLTFATIARILDRSPSSISREIKRYRVFIKSNRAFNGNDCTKRPTCLHNKLCSDAPRQGCWLSRCKTCPDYKCYEICPDYESPDCTKLDKPPYVCTGCDKQKRCRKNHTLIRRVIPKSTNLNSFTKEQIHLLTRHINSYYREEYGNKTPFELMVTKEQKKLLSALELTPIAPDEVLLTPQLIKK